MKEPKKAIRGSGRVAFLARLEGIKKMVDEGHPLLSIYQTYEKDLSFRYSQFVKYVNRYIRSKPDGSSGRAREEVKKAVVVRTREPGQPAFVSSDTPRDKDSLVKRKE